MSFRGRNSVAEWEDEGMRTNYISERVYGMSRDCSGKEPEAWILDRMSWPEVEEQMENGMDLVLIPVGSTEQHGYNGTFGVDTGRAEGFVRRLAERLYPRALAVPAVPYGIAPHHMNFPGTMTLEPETFIAVLEDLVDSMYRHGFRKFFLANGHGGNRPAMTLLMGKLRARYPDIDASWASFTSAASDIIRENVDSSTHGHACEAEISQAMYLAPWSVKEDRRPGEVVMSEEEYQRRQYIGRAETFDDITRDGALGDATKASWDLGKKIAEKALDEIADYLRDF